MAVINGLSERPNNSNIVISLNIDIAFPLVLLAKACQRIGCNLYYMSCSIGALGR